MQRRRRHWRGGGGRERGRRVWMLSMERLEMPGWARIFVGAAWLHGGEALIVRLQEM